MLIGQVAARLRRDAVRTGGDGAVRISGVAPANDKIIRSFGDLVDLLEAELGDDSLRGSWVAGSAVTGSINALLRRLRSAVKPLNAIIRGDLAHRGERSISTSRAQVTVVDLHNLPDRAQRFVQAPRLAAPDYGRRLVAAGRNDRCPAPLDARSRSAATNGVRRTSSKTCSVRAQLLLLPQFADVGTSARARDA